MSDNHTQRTSAPVDLSSRAMLVDVTIRRWTARKMDRKLSDETADTHNASREMLSTYKRLLPADEVDKKIVQFVNNASMYYRRMTVPWTDDGARMLSSLAVFDFTQVMRKFAQQWNEMLMPEFQHTYPQRYAEAKRLLNGTFNPDDYPPAHKIMDRFGFKYVLYPVPTLEGLRTELFGGNAAAAAQAQADLANALAEAMQRTVNDVLTRMQTVVGHMVERLNAYNPDGQTRGEKGIFHDTLISNVESLLEIIPMLNISNDPTVNQFARRMVELIRFEPAELREDEAARAATLKAAQDIQQKLAEWI